ncbi:MAG: DUF6152 family protein [Gammaproteobacteria bacterium]|nr:DUF6152 family protein [Gammaproteobacteria bacterium]
MNTRCLMLFVLLASDVANAHHSRAAFNLDSNIEIEGTLVELAWRNPHAFVVVESIDEDGNTMEWTFEGHSIAGLMRNGWSPNSFEIGERVVVDARPNRDPQRTFGLLNHVTRANGETLYAFSRPPEDAPPPRRPIAPSTDFSGTWRPVLILRQTLVGGFEPPADWPYTEKGLAEVAIFDINDDPGLDCESYPMPRIMRFPYNQLWEVVDGNLIITHEQATTVRTVNMNAEDVVPASHVPDQNGYSTGRIDAQGSLTITTRGFADTKWGSERGVSSSDQKVVVETYRLTDGGYGLELTYTITDPQYLTESVQLGRNFRLVPDYEFTDEPCDPVAARRHLQFD